MRVGFVGLGSQGAPMARRIVDAGFPTVLWARRPEALQSFADSAAELAPSRRALGATVDVLCVCVVDDAGVGEVLRGPEGALVDMAPGSIVVVHSTVHPTTCLRLQDDFPTFRFVDAPVSGGGDKAAAGELLVMAGGPAEAVERCRPVFATYGDPVLRVGGLGTGLVAKLLNNALFAAQLALAAEVYERAARLGLDRAVMASIISGGSGTSYAAELLAMVGFSLDALSTIAGPLLAKDVGILATHLDTDNTALLGTAEEALTRMGTRPKLGDHDDS
jgi:3-hydroxyisobutyrate dehydrogenase-like beta-hydroxyacid dehydrogenase